MAVEREQATVRPLDEHRIEAGSCGVSEQGAEHGCRAPGSGVEDAVQGRTHIPARRLEVAQDEGAQAPAERPLLRLQNPDRGIGLGRRQRHHPIDHRPPGADAVAGQDEADRREGLADALERQPVVFLCAGLQHLCHVPAEQRDPVVRIGFSPVLLAECGARWRPLVTAPEPAQRRAGKVRALPARLTARRSARLHGSDDRCNRTANRTWP